MTNAEHIRQSLVALREIGHPDVKLLAAQLSAELLLRGARRAMSERLEATSAMLAGKWWHDKDVEVIDLLNALNAQCQKGLQADIRDVLNLAAMVYIRQACDMPECLPENNAVIEPPLLNFSRLISSVDARKESFVSPLSFAGIPPP